MALQTYISPLRYQHGGYGIEFTGTVLAMRNKLVAATAAVNTWCNGSLIPEQHDFRGGTVVGERHIFRGGTALLSEPGDRRIFLNHRPIRTVSSVTIEWTPTYSISVDSDQLFVSSQGFVEIVAINPTIVGFPPFGYMVGPYDPFSVTNYTYGWQFTATSDVLEAISPTQFMASHGSWLEGGTVTVEIDGVEVDPADYSYNTDDGTVTFATAPAPGEVATVSYVYTLPPAIEQATALIVTDMIGQARLATRGMTGLQSIRVAEVALTQMSPSQMSTKNGVSIPISAANFLAPFAIGSAA